MNSTRNNKMDLKGRYKLLKIVSVNLQLELPLRHKGTQCKGFSAL